MANPSSTFTELVSTTYRRHRSELMDNVSKNNALLTYLKRKKKMRTEPGGLSIVVPLEYAENGTYQRYNGYDILNVAQSDVITSAEYNWQQIAVNVTASGRELRINKGPEQIVKLAKSRMRNAMHTFNNQFSADIYSSGALANQIGGIQLLVADAGTGTVGGIVSGTWTFWKNAVQSAAAPLQGGGAITPGPTTIESLMLPLWLQLTRGADHPDLIVMSNDYYTLYEQSQVSIKRYVSNDNADGGFMSLKYHGADVIFDGGSGIPTAHAYFLNTEYLELVAHEDANMTINEQMTPYNQDAVVTPILWMGNLTVSNRSLQGVMKA